MFQYSGSISDEGFISLCSSISKLTLLEEIKLRFSGREDISDEGIKKLAQGLIKLRHLQSINLNFPRKELTDKGISELSKCFQELDSLKSLALNFADIQEITQKGLGNLQKALQKLTSLQSFSLDLTRCQNINDTGMLHLAKGLQDLTSLQELTLILKECEIVSENGFSWLAVLVKKLKNSLKKVHFDFSFTPALNDVGISSLFASLSTLKNLQTLHLDFSIEDGVFSLGRAMREFGSIENLPLDFETLNQVSDTAFLTLIQSFKKLTSLQNLDLNFKGRDLKIGDSLFFNLGESFSRLKSLRNVVLRLPIQIEETQEHEERYKKYLQIRLPDAQIILELSVDA